MSENKQLEFTILDYVVRKMESDGLTVQQIKITFDQELADQIRAEYKISFSNDEFETAIKKCIVNDWIKPDNLNPYCAFTNEGFEVVKSKRKEEELKRSRGYLKKISDDVVDHKGLFIMSRSIVGFFKFLWKLFKSS